MENSEYIDNYFSGTPDPVQVRSFENRIESDPVFAEEVAYYLSVHTLTREVSQSIKKQQFREIYQKSLKESPSIPVSGKPISIYSARSTPVRNLPLRKLIYYMAAAAVVAGISFGIYINVQRVSPQELAVRFERDHLTTLPVTMSGHSDSEQTGLRLYNDGKLQEAQLQFEQIIERDSSYYPAIKYAGLACLRLKNYDRAIYYFKKLEAHTELYSNPAIFYQAVTLMERNHPGDNASAKQLLQQVVEKDLDEKDAAQIMLEKW